MLVINRVFALSICYDYGRDGGTTFWFALNPHFYQGDKRYVSQYAGTAGVVAWWAWPWSVDSHGLPVWGSWAGPTLRFYENPIEPEVCGETR